MTSRAFIHLRRSPSSRIYCLGPILYDIESLCFTVRFPFPFCSRVIVGRGEEDGGDALSALVASRAFRYNKRARRVP